ncbi:MAG: hypothetical protein V1817_00085, partial [Candidatus Micrarchaeota archaeon]
EGMAVACAMPGVGRDCRQGFYNHYWTPSEKATLRALVGYKTSYFARFHSENYFPAFGVSANGVSNSFWAFQTTKSNSNAKNNFWFKPPFKLEVAAGLLNPPSGMQGDPRPGIALYAVDSNNNWFSFSGRWVFNSSSVTVYKPDNSSVIIRGLNGGSFSLSCDEYEWNLLGECEVGNYDFTFDSTGVFLEQKPCLKVKANFDGTSFVILSQTPGVMMDSKCVSNPAVVLPPIAAAAPLEDEESEVGDGQNSLVYSLLGVLGLFIVVSALVWHYKFAKKK